MTIPLPVAYDRLCDAPSRTIEELALRTVHPVTYRGEQIATVRRPVARSEVPDGIEVVAINGLQRRGRDERAQLLRAGGAFAISCHGRRIAVVEGVKK